MRTPHRPVCIEAIVAPDDAYWQLSLRTRTSVTRSIGVPVPDALVLLRRARAIVRAGTTVPVTSTRLPENSFGLVMPDSW
jgi:hypothetical protein